jgi:VanZ family protein
LPYIDKIVHLLWYTLLSFLVLNAVLLRKENYAMLKAFSYAFSVGFVIEAIQLFIPYRSFEFADIIFNSLGAAVGILVKII